MYFYMADHKSLIFVFEPQIVNRRKSCGNDDKPSFTVAAGLSSSVMQSAGPSYLPGAWLNSYTEILIMLSRRHVKDSAFMGNNMNNIWSEQQRQFPYF
jgi:hypothetical protein